MHFELQLANSIVSTVVQYFVSRTAKTVHFGATMKGTYMYKLLQLKQQKKHSLEHMSTKVQKSRHVTTKVSPGEVGVTSMVLVFFLFFNQVENAGDPWNFTNGQHLNYFDCLYFLVVGMRILLNMLLRVLVLY